MGLCGDRTCLAPMDAWPAGGGASLVATAQEPASDGTDGAEAVVATVAECFAAGRTLAIAGHGSKRFLGEAQAEATLSVAGHNGVIAHRPNELVLTARAGTPLAHIEQVLRAHRQMLPFDPPQFGGKGTFGGAVAAGLAGPARPWRGAVRDSVLGVEIVNGTGERLRFGGAVIKNVAGYDVSRLVTGALGTLGVILSASVRLLPMPEAEQTLVRECNATDAGRLLRAWARWPLPITATCFESGLLRVRVSGAQIAIADAATELGMQMRDPDPTFWRRLRDHELDWFDGDAPLTRIAIPRGTPFDRDDALIEWGGSQAWLRERDVDAPPGGHVQGYRPIVPTAVASPALARYMRRVKEAFDPKGILNPGLAPVDSA